MECNQIVFYIITGCTHNCKLCVSGVPYYKAQRKNYVVALSNAKQEIDAVFKLFSYIKRITVTGGEPLLHPELTEILDYIMKYSEQFGECRVFSNGSLFPSEKLFSVVKNSNQKLSFVINDYGAKLSPHAEKIHQRTGCRVNHYTGNNQYFNGWVNFGALDKKRPYNEDDAFKVISNCHFTDWKMYNIFQGKLFYCTRAAIGADLGFFELDERDYLALISHQNNSTTALTLEQQREKIKALGTFPTQACYYCDGFDIKNSVRYPAAEQIGEKDHE